MINYEQFNKKHGIRLIRDFLTPLVWDSTIISYPKQSALFWYNPTNTLNCPNSEYGYFHNLHKPYVLTITEYTEFHHLGTPRYKKPNLSSLIRDCKKQAPKFKFIKDPSSKVKVPTNSEIIFNLGVINKQYKYISHPLTNYHIWYNTFHTIVDILKSKNSGVNRHKYLIVPIPYSIPNKMEIDKYLPELTRPGLDVFLDSSYFNLLDIFRFISKEHKDKSILNTLDPNDFKYIDLVFTINNKSVFVNLETLASITDAHTVTSKLKKYPSDTIEKLLIVFFNRILEMAPMVTDKVSDKESNMLGITSLTDIDLDLDNKSKEKESVNINKVLEEDIVDKEEPVVEDDLNKDIDSSLDAIVIEDSVEDATAISLEDVNKESELTDTSNLKKSIEELFKNKIISKTVKDNLINSLEEQNKKYSPYNDNKKLKEMLTYTNEEVELTGEDTSIKDSPSVVDKTMNQDTLTVANNKYLKETYRKDILSTIYSIQRSGVVIHDHEVTINKSVLGDEEEHKLTLQSLDGSKSTIKIVLPVLRDDNTIMMSGNKYIIRKQRADIPLKKISNTIVSVNSYYGKLFISKATYKKDDLGFWFYKQLLKKYDTDKDLKDIAALSVIAPDTDVPRHYGIVSRYIKSFKYKNIVFNFDYKDRKNLIKDIDLNKVEKKGVLVGHKGKTPIVMDKDNILYSLDNDTKLGTIFEYLGFDINDGPMEYLNVKIYKENIPLAVIVSYYIGFHHLLKLLKPKYYTVEANKRVTLNKNQFRIKFLDKTYVIDKDYGVNDLILGGFKSIEKYTKNISVTSLMSKSKFTALFTAMNLPILYVNEIKLMETMYIDPITKQILELYKYPTKFVGVLIKSAEILNDDNYKHPNSIYGAILKGYERISGMMYLELVKALRLNVNKSHFGKSKIEINPYSIKNKINEDSTTVLVDDLNPVANLKQFEDVTYLGSHGRKEETMSASTRVMHPSEIGIISEGTKDNGAVGISAYLTAAPKIKTTRGTVDKIKDKDGWANILSTSAMLAPFAIKDDVKRLNFVGIQNAHVIPMNEMRAPYIRTGYEAILPVRVSDNYVISAEDDGEVVSVSNTNITVKYKKLGKKKYPLKEWTTKEESNTTYKHKLVPNLNKGDKFLKDDSLAYDIFFFEPDIFNPKRVIYKMGTSVSVALMEAPETYEDSIAISSKMSKRMGTKVTKVKSIIVNNTDNIIKPLSVGDEVNPKSPILSIADETLSSVSNLDDKALEILKGLKMLTPKAGYKGVITRIKVFYNCELSDLTPTLKKLAKQSDEILLEETGATGRVNSSYSIQGKPLLENSIEIKYYIEISEGMGTGDKAILSNQLKCTVGRVYDTPVISESGIEIEAIFSTRSIEARIVNSPGLIGTTSKLLEVVSNQACDLYFN